MVPKKEVFIMRFKRFISFSLGAAMLVSGGGVNAFAEERSLDDPAVGTVYSVGGLSTPKIVSTSKDRANIKIRWKAVKGATGYKVYRKTKSGKYKSVATVKGGKLTYIAELLNSHTKYTFKVRAYKKSKGRTTFSKYSAAKSVTTRYGQGTHNYSCKNFSIEDKNNMWKISSFEDWYYDHFALFDYSPAGEVKDDCYCLVTSRKWKGVTLKDAVEDFLWNVDESAFYSDDPDAIQSNDYTVTYSKKFGADCALLELTKFPEKRDMTVIICENGIVYEISYGYLRSNTDGKNELKKLLKTIKLTY